MNTIEDQARATFLAALERAPDQWPAFLDEACGPNAEWRARVEQLLHAHQALGSIRGGAALAATVDEPMRERPGSVIGFYKLLEQIGEGGFGVVFMAEQSQPIRRKVALKVLKPGMDSRQVVARFEAERQALAIMDHPNIAKVHDGGATPSGRPYFVMELVKGVPITEFCDQNQLTPRQRLELFIPVCQAVQHAHQKGIIHRDLKPSNILVVMHDTTPVPKVIDFGVAKALGHELTDKTLFTGFAQMVGTPLYMSPEQAGQSGLDVDTRSDVYSLGVLLYELLTGTTPFPRERFKQAAYDEIRRIIREEEPPRPSTRLSESKDALPSISAQRQTEPAKLTRLVRGELDWIVMKALEKDRNRRYETANGFARDIERFLHDEPVQACPPSSWYRFRKFTRRNKTPLAITGLILFFLVLLVGGGGWARWDRAVRVEQVRLDRTARQAVLEERVGQALKEAAARQAQGKWIEALATATRAEELLAAEGSDELRRQARELRAHLALVIEVFNIRLQGTGVKDDHFDWAAKDPAYAQVFRDHGFDFANGVSVPEAAERIRATGIAVELSAALDDWAMVCRSTRPKADTTWKDLLAISRAANPDPLRNQLRDAWARRDVKALERLAASEKVADLPAVTVVALGSALADSGAVQAAVDLLRRVQRRQPADFWINHELALALRRMNPPELDEAIGYFRAAVAVRPESPGAHLNLGNALANKDRMDEAIAEFQEAIRLQNDYAGAHDNLGKALKAMDRLDEAIAEFEAAIRLKKDSHQVHYNLGNALLAAGRLDDAIANYQEAIRLKKDYPEAHHNLGTAFHDNGRVDEAIAEYRETIRLKQDYPEAHYNLGSTLLRAKGLVDEAIAEFQEAIRLKNDHTDAHLDLGSALRAKGRLDDAIAEYQEAIRLKKDYAAPHNNLGLALFDKQRVDEAIAEYREALRLRQDFPEAHANLGNALHAKGLQDDAIAEYREAIRLKKDFAGAHHGLGNALYAKGRLDDAIAEYQEAVRLKKDFPQAHVGLGGALCDKGRPDEAIAVLQEAIRLQKDDPVAHLNLGNAWLDKRRLDDAIAEYQEAVRLKKDYPEALCNLGKAFLSKGQFAQGLAYLRSGHEHGIKKPGWRYPSAQWVRQAERLVALDEKLPLVLSGKEQPRDTAERLALAKFCQMHRKLNVAATRFYAEACALEPKWNGDQPSDPRYDAACTAALAGCGQGEDAKALDEKERARLRGKALEWLQADLAACRRLLEKGSAKARPAVAFRMQWWLKDSDFDGVRGSAALGRLPAAERPDWQKLWQEVEELRHRAAQPAGDAKIDK